jgi:DNA helicase-2/ATP-dependent DNA helicase PcrA
MNNFLNELSNEQREAVVNYQGPTLIIAGAGSGKTRVLTYRIAYTLQQGVAPQAILALTFTNKAAREMKERIGALVGADTARRLWMGTFHSVFARILRSEAERIGYPASFTIYDASDSKSVVRACLKEMQLDEATYKPAKVSGRISMAKNNLLRAADYAASPQVTASDAAARCPHIADVYALYERKCRLAGAMDFDDLLLNTNLLLRDCPDVLERYAQLFRYLLVDEYQDTNYAQYLIVKRLARTHRNICVVGDDAQSIYSFRGARIENILNFRNDYPDYNEYRLEENYRSTQTIVNAANHLIAKNNRQLKKKCFSRGDVGEKIGVFKAYTDQEESFLVAGSIADTVYQQQRPFSEFAILYRTNAQSRTFEEALRKRNLPYRIYGGTSFYQRAEVKDLLAYFRLIVNPQDDEAFKRAIQTPARGVGDTTLERLQAAAGAAGLSLYAAATTLAPQRIGLRAPAPQKLHDFCRMITELASRQLTLDAHELATEAAHRSGYIAELKKSNTLEDGVRLEYVEELLNSIREFCDNPENHQPDDENQLITLGKYLENVALLTDMDNDKPEDRNRVTLMTVHSAKGLEFAYVYIAGMEESLFPGTLSTGSQDDLEEERRLFYVALTRAKCRAHISFANMRYQWGKLVANPPSRFLREIDERYFEKPIFTDRDAAPHRNAPPAERGSMAPVGNAVGRRTAPPAAACTPPPPARPNFASDNPGRIAAGMTVEHDRFGIGRVVAVEGAMPHAKAIVDFNAAGQKTLLLQYAKVKIIKKS